MTKLLSRKTIHQGRLFTVAEETWQLDNGATIIYERIYRFPSVSIVPFISPTKILLLREWRPTNKRWEWRLPCGRVDKESMPLSMRLEKIPMVVLKKAAQRELQEEAGYKAKTLKHIYTRYTGASIVAPTYVFTGHSLTPSQLPQDIDEKIEVHALPLAKAATLAIRGEIQEEVMAITLIRLHKKTL